MPWTKATSRPHFGFTLVELVVVILILGILAGVAAPRFLDVSEEGREAVAAATVQQIADQIELQTARAGKLPAGIQPEWFQSKQVPDSPYNEHGVPKIQTVRAAGRDHPIAKVIVPSAPGAFWYNQANGAIRIRVPPQRTADETLQLYNQVNYDSVADLSSEISDATATVPPT